MIALALLVGFAGSASSLALAKRLPRLGSWSLLIALLPNATGWIVAFAMVG